MCNLPEELVLMYKKIIKCVLMYLVLFVCLLVYALYFKNNEKTPRMIKDAVSGYISFCHGIWKFNIVNWSKL